jgi:FAD/FMN-containing dehydrogenase
MKRRRFLAGTFALAGVSAARFRLARGAPAGRVRPGTPGWPGEADWTQLKHAVGGRLAPVARPDFADPAVGRLLRDPFYLGDQPALAENSGWLDAWRSAPSAYVVAAESAADVAAAIRFARAHNVRLVVRGGGHSYLGTSTAPDSLMIWTRRMNAIKVHDAFTPVGSKAAPVPAVSAGAGCIWLHLYQAVTGGAGRYVQGGGCTTVGVAGLLLGGGFGSFSKRYGLAAASLLEAEIVTADGTTRIVNAAQEPDLFWALKGGGGGTFGVVTRVTLATHELPATFGSVRLDIEARSDDAYRRLLARFVDLYATNLFNPHWGEQALARPDNRLQIRMVFQGLTQQQATAAWQPLIEFLKAHASDYDGADSFQAHAMPARYFWAAGLYRRYAPGAVHFDTRPGASPNDFWWNADADQVGAFWYAYTSAWLPASLLKPENRARFVDAWFAASRNWGLVLAFNKGLAGAPPDAIKAAHDTATNPDVADAFAWAVTAAHGPPAFPGSPGPGLATRVRELIRGLLGYSADGLRTRVAKTMMALRAVAPDTGTYVNECDYFQQDWQKAFWGPNYPRLLAIKRRYDPNGLFTVHHGVGSEGWSPDGFTRSR